MAFCCAAPEPLTQVGRHQSLPGINVEDERVRALMEQRRHLRERADSLAETQAEIAAQLEEAMSLAADLRKKSTERQGDPG